MSIYHKLLRSISFLCSSTKLIAKSWKDLPIHCSLCCLPLTKGSISKGEWSVWCSNCQKVIELPLLKAPNWITGTLAILIVNLY